ncbi:MAG: tetratricopeptide repeat protein [Crocinitomicaceae bacterium]|nr:tetratricopeptide repeat protein [Crocinitomicaceae bacterium]
MKLIAFTFILFVCFISLGQDVGSQSENCKKYKYLYSEYFKQGMYEDSRNFWLQSHQWCGGTDSLESRFFQNGIKIYGQLYRQSADEIRKQEIVDTLYWVYEQGSTIDKSNSWRLDYANFLVKTGCENFSKIDSLYTIIDSIAGNSEPEYIKTYYKHMVLNKYNKAEQENKSEMLDQIINEYFKLYFYTLLSEQENVKANDTSKVAEIRATQDYMNKYFIRLIPSIDHMNNIMLFQFDSMSNVFEIRQSQVNNRIFLMTEKNALKTDAYKKYVYESLQLSPTAEGYFSAGMMEFESGKYEESIEAFKRAIEIDSNKVNDDKYLYHLSKAQFHSGQYTEAFSNAAKVSGEFKGKAYKIQGDCVAQKASKCGDSSFERDANYWLANDYYLKAAQQGENVNTKTYLDKAPSKEECFNNSVQNDQLINCKCWNESTKVRF